MLALGDSGYDLFCEAGRRLDRRLLELGGARLGPRVELDVDDIKCARQSIGAVVSMFTGARAACAQRSAATRSDHCRAG